MTKTPPSAVSLAAAASFLLAAEEAAERAAEYRAAADGEAVAVALEALAIDLRVRAAELDSKASI